MVGLDKPKLRFIDIFPVEVSGKRLLYLRDPLHYGEDIVVSPVMIEILRFFTGENSIPDIQYKLMKRTGELIEAQLIEKIAEQLDEHLLLDSERFRAVRRKVEEDFLAQPVRAAAHAGSCYADDAPALEKQLTEFFQQGAGLPQEQGKQPRVRAIIAPHIDLRVAGHCYSSAYRELAESVRDAETVIILGTSHYGSGGLFIGTEKDFRTPLGDMAADREFIAALRAELGEPMNGDESAHRLEHSIEFQVLFLQSIFKARLPKIVPILVTSFHNMLTRVNDPREDAEFARFTGALKRTVAQWPKSVAFIVGADLSHIGRKFGDDFAAAPRLSEIERADREMLEAVVAGDAQAFFRSIQAVGDCRRVCGFPPILTLMATLDRVKGRLLQYDQWHERATESAVTYASLAFYED